MSKKYPFVDEKAEAFADQWCLKDEDRRVARLAWKAGFCESQKLKDSIHPYRGLIGIFRRIWLTWHKARYDSLETLYLHVFMAEREMDLEREKVVEAKNKAMREWTAK